MRKVDDDEGFLFTPKKPDRTPDLDPATDRRRAAKPKPSSIRRRYPRVRRRATWEHRG